ncbi:NACHT domain-containing protein [Actinoplanes missouriensis]|uniref:NACHT domain-containing protein n=1 Tax=Actinoplanes missouriensis TaxID=1866 RepID=UPI0033E6EE9B
MPATESVWQSPEVVAAYIIGAITLVGFLVTYLTMHFQRRLAQERAEADDRLARERAKWESRQQQTAAAEAEQKTEEAKQRRLLLAADDRERAALEYKASLISELKALRVLDMAKPLDLNALYVQVKIREDESRRYVAEEEIEALAAGHPAALLDATAARTVAKHAEAVPPEDALTRYQHVVVLGDPGAGKTTMLKHLAFRICKGEISGLTGVPIFVELRRFIDSGMADILEFAIKDCADKYGFAGAGDYVRERLTNGTAALLFDGLDEVLGGSEASQATDAYRKAAGEISRLCARYPKAPIAVTCRRAGFNGGLDRFQILEVLDFTWDQSRRFLENWFAGRQPEFRDLVNSLNRNVRMKTLAANPLILSLIAIVYENDLELPERRSELYNRCVEVLLKEWDSKRGIRRYSQFTTDRKRDLMEELAWHFHVQGKRYFPESEVLSMIRAFLPTIGLSDASPADVLKEIAANYGLVKEQATGWYGFWHLTIQEYFAAVWANEHFSETRDHLLAHRHDPWWEEVLLLLAGRMSDATDLLLGIAGIAGRDASLTVPLVPDDDVVHRDLLLMGECLLAAPRIRHPELRGRISESLWQIAQSSAYTETVDQALRILVVLGEKNRLNEISDRFLSKNVDLGARFSIGRVIGQCGDESFVASVLDQAIGGDFSPASSFILQGAHERGFRSAGVLALKGVERLAADGELPAYHYGLDDFLRTLGDVDGEVALDWVRVLLPRVLEAKKGKDEFATAAVGAVCAKVAAQQNAYDLAEAVRAAAAVGQASIIGGTDYLLGILGLHRPGEESVVADAIAELRIYPSEELKSKLAPFWTDAIQSAVTSRFLASRGEISWNTFDLLDVAPTRSELIRDLLRNGLVARADMTEALAVLLAHDGDHRARRDVRNSFRRRLLSKDLDFGLVSRQARVLVDIGLTDFVVNQVADFISSADPTDGRDVANLYRSILLVPDTRLDSIADLLWSALERFTPVLASSDERFVEVVSALTCNATVGRVLKIELPDSFYRVYSIPGNKLRDRLVATVDAESLPHIVALAAKFDTGSLMDWADGLASVLLRLNYRLYPDGRLEPAVPQGPASRWTSTS